MKLGYNLYSVLSGIMGLLGAGLASMALKCGVSDISYFIEWEIGSMGSSSVTVSLIFDFMSLTFLGVVSLISSCILKFSEYYMESEKNFIRFVLLLMLFVGSMWLLIVSPNLISLLLGWDGLGLTSYALIVFYQSEVSGNAGMLTILSNRIGDVAILMSIGLMSSLGSWNFLFFDEVSGPLCWLVVLAGMTKSAQIPFSAWLPAAMAAPTPVSALVHSSTLVTAGVYLLIRFSEALSNSGACWWLSLASSSTMLMAGLGANFELDLKKVVALSTLSQLGLMVLSVSVGLSELAFFHLITHALFKSTLFMCSGFMIHNMSGSQDLRSIVGLSASSPLISVVFKVTNLALSGIPFLAGFYSKDVILESISGGSLNLWLSTTILVSTGTTIAYSLRIMYLSSEELSSLSSVSGSEDASLGLTKALGSLFFGSVVSGFVLSWLVLPYGAVSVLSSVSKSQVLVVMLVMGLVAFYLFSVKDSDLGEGEVKKSVSSMWHLPLISKKLGSVPMYSGSGRSAKVLDGGWLEVYGGQGGRSLFLRLSNLSSVSVVSLGVSSYFIGAAGVTGWVYLIMWTGK